MAKQSHLEQLMAACMVSAELPRPEVEYKFHPDRRWRFDFAYPDLKIAIEIEGGTFVNGRHNRGAGFQSDCQKYNEAGLLGWTVYRFTGAMVRNGEAVSTINRALNENS